MEVILKILGMMILCCLVGYSITWIFTFILGFISGEPYDDPDYPFKSAWDKGAGLRNAPEKISDALKDRRWAIIDARLIYLISNDKDGGLLTDVYYEACQRYCEEHGGWSGDQISQCCVSYAGLNYDIVFARHGKKVLVSIRQ